MNESVNYKSNLEHTETNDCNIYQYFPSNGSTFKCGTDNFIEMSEFQWRSRQIRLSFTYRINQTKKRSRGDRDDDSGGDDMEF